VSDEPTAQIHVEGYKIKCVKIGKSPFGRYASLELDGKQVKVYEGDTLKLVIDLPVKP
jgi:hypothetical protein